MIIDAFLYLAGSLLYLIGAAFSVISFIVPSGFRDSLEYFISKLAYMENFFPVSTLMTALGIILSFLGFWYTIKVIAWAVNFLPGFKTSTGPKMEGHIVKGEHRNRTALSRWKKRR